MYKFLILLAAVACIQVATGLDCYKCDKCSAVESDWMPVHNCGAKTPDPTKYVGACLRVVEKDSKNQEVITRKCITGEKTADNKVSYTCRPSSADMTLVDGGCKVCTTDYCNKNSASGISLSAISFLGVIMALLVPKYL